ncbi:hypothetical protein DINM_002225 [Dirofilaria immitis]|nr:hypothetical protein [Dirofilaria immitis]
MNSFCGRFNECNWITVDQFGLDNLKSSAFFLSHCHTDKETNDMRICRFLLFAVHSNPTDEILYLDFMYMNYNEHIVPKNYGEKFTITAICNNEKQELLLPSSSVDVTFLDAQHIPGSAMILFEFHDGFRLLYTGDCRLSKDDWIACDMLKDPFTSSGFKRLDALYFDNTFCRRGAENIPALKQSCALFVKMVKEWLEKDSNNKVLIWCGRFGHELLLKAVWNELHVKCHVTVMKYRIYSKIDFLADCITPLAQDTRVHACTAKPSVTEEISTCWYCRPDRSNVRVIKPSAMCALGYENNRFCRLLYAGHCSLTETENALNLLRPVRAYPNTTDKHSKDFAEKLMKYFR